MANAQGGLTFIKEVCSFELEAESIDSNLCKAELCDVTPGPRAGLHCQEQSLTQMSRYDAILG